MIRELYTTTFAMLTWCFAFSISNAQFHDQRTHLTPSSGALRASDMDAWDEIECRVATHDAKNRESKTFVYTLRKERIENTPKWEVGQLSPKVPPGLALHLAKRHYEKLRPFGDSNYKYEIHMQQYWERWLWAVIFRHDETDGVTEDQVFPVFVLMDGKVLQPEIQ